MHRNSQNKSDSMRLLGPCWPNLATLSCRSDMLPMCWQHSQLRQRNFAHSGKQALWKMARRESNRQRSTHDVWGIHSEDHTANVFWMYCPETSRISQTHDVIWLGRMLHTRHDADLIKKLPIVTVSISMDDTYADDTYTQKLEVSTFPLFEQRGV